jgi:hypothetical protein
MQLRGGKVKKGIVVVKATHQSKPSAPKPKSRKYKKNKSKKYLLNNFHGGKKKILLVTTEDFKSWSGDAGDHNFKSNMALTPDPLRQSPLTPLPLPRNTHARTLHATRPTT